MRKISPMRGLHEPDKFFDAEIAACEALINCFLRESGIRPEIQNGALELRLPKSGAVISAPVTEVLQLGDVRLAGPLPDLNSSALAEILASEIQGDKPLHPDRKSDWKVNFEDSLAVSKMILDFRGGHPAESANQSFLASEQSLTLGHRFHPSPKSRIGFSESDHLRYSPELGAKFPLHYFSVPKSECFAAGGDSELEAWSQTARQFLSLPTGWIAIPVHPWQAREALRNPRFIEAVKSGSVCDHGLKGPEVYPTSSVRTVYQPEWDLFLKTSLDVRITNCFRPNLQKEMLAASKISKLVEKENLDTGSFRIMRESLCLDVPEKLGVHLGVIFREGLRSPNDLANPRPDDRILLAASLFGDRQYGTSRLGHLIGTDREAIKAWFRTYCRLFVPHLIKLFWVDGLMLEAHLQNILIEIESGQPTRILQRDLDNAKLIRGGALDLKSEGSLKHSTYVLETGWKRFTYCLFVNHLAEAISAFAHLSSDVSALENSLWKVLAEVLADEEIPLAARARLFGDESLWVKKNFFTRIVRNDDLSAPFASIPNPLIRHRPL